MSETRSRNFGHTAAALLVYDSGAAARAQAWAAAETETDVEAAEIADRAALHEVQLAYFWDTSDINSRVNCMRADLAFMQRMAQGSTPYDYGSQQAQSESSDHGDDHESADAPAPR